MFERSTGPTHRYIGACAGCWSVFGNLFNGGEPAVAPTPLWPLVQDAYMVQHPGVPSPQSTQSVAGHLLALYGCLRTPAGPGAAMWIRVRAVRKLHEPKHARFWWLDPPPFEDCMTVRDIAGASTPEARAGVGEAYVAEVWRRWEAVHLETVRSWYQSYVVDETRR